jgi:hypothetical protein
VNLTRIRTLDLSYNWMPSPPHNVWHILPQLAWLSLAHNPFTALKNESFLSLDRVHHLDISRMALTSLEVGNHLFQSVQDPTSRHLTDGPHQH